VALAIPGWVGLWFAIFPTVEGLVAQVLAAALVLGSYFGAEYWRIKRPRKRAEAATVAGPRLYAYRSGDTGVSVRAHDESLLVSATTPCR